MADEACVKFFPSAGPGICIRYNVYLGNFGGIVSHEKENFYDTDPLPEFVEFISNAAPVQIGFTPGQDIGNGEQDSCNYMNQNVGDDDSECICKCNEDYWSGRQSIHNIGSDTNPDFRMSLSYWRASDGWLIGKYDYKFEGCPPGYTLNHETQLCEPVVKLTDVTAECFVE